MWHAAFIDGKRGKTIPGLPGTWIPEPWGVGYRWDGYWYTSTSNRSFQAHTMTNPTPSSKLWVTTEVATGQLDKLTPKIVLTGWGADPTCRARVTNDPIRVHPIWLGVYSFIGAAYTDYLCKQSTPSVSVEILQASKCSAKFKVKASNQYPFPPPIPLFNNAITPNIDYKATWTIDVFGAEYATVWGTFTHNRFPDHEVITWGPDTPIKGDLLYTYAPASWSSPNPITLNAWKASSFGITYNGVYVPPECMSHQPRQGPP